VFLFKILTAAKLDNYKVFQKEWTGFKLLSWPYYMQAFAETTFNENGIV